jgi:hypothetical protein
MFGKLENPVCPICHEEYQNDQTRKPFMLPKCGHSICEECLKKLISLSSETVKSIPCPICRKTSLTTTFHSIKDFSENYSLMEAVEIISNYKIIIDGKGQTDCPSHKNTQNWICLSPECQANTLNCFRCSFSDHPLCQSDFQFEIKDAKDKLVFVPYSKSQEEFETMISDKIEKFKNEIESFLKTEFENFSSKLKEMFRLSTVEDLTSNKSHYKILINRTESCTKLKIIPKNKAKIDSLYSFSDLEVWLEEFFRKMNFSELSRQLDDFLKLF